MNPESRRIQKTYLVLLALQTLAASFIWGINTLFLLDAGLNNTQAFAANAFFTAGMVLFEVPTGVIADTRGRRTSYLLGTFTLALSTLLYLLMWRVSAPFWAWALASALLGLGFTFFSGAFEAWLVDALTSSGYLARRRNAGVGAGQRRNRRGHCDARRIGRGRGHRAGDQPWRSLHPACDRACPHLRLCLGNDARHGVHAEPQQTPHPGSQKRRARLRRARTRQPSSALGDAGRAVHRGRDDLRVLRNATISVGPVRRPTSLCCRRTGGRHRRRSADCGRPSRPAYWSALSAGGPPCCSGAR